MLQSLISKTHTKFSITESVPLVFEVFSQFTYTHVRAYIYQAKGLSVEFSKFQSGSRFPVPLADKSAVQYSPLGDCCPDPGPIPTLEFINNGDIFLKSTLFSIN